MAKPPKNGAPTDLVAHSRYGRTSKRSGVRGFSAQDIAASHWRYDIDTIFPESVLVADTSRQNYSMYPRPFYVDMRRTCRSCSRPFIFFAAEQKHWFEVLQFYVDADCVHCPECRQQRVAAKREFQRYTALVGIETPSVAELKQLVDLTVSLLAQGVLKNRARLGALKNRALQRLAGYSGTLALVEALRNVDLSVAGSDSV